MKKNKGFVAEKADAGKQETEQAAPDAVKADGGKKGADKVLKELKKPGGDLDPKVLQKRFDENKKDVEAMAAAKKKDEAKKAKEKAEADEKRKKAAKLAKTRDVTPKPTPKKAKEKAAAAPKKAGGIGGLVCKLLIGGKDTDAILAAVKKDFPKAKTSPASIAWYRSKLREEGKIK